MQTRIPKFPGQIFNWRILNVILWVLKIALLRLVFGDSITNGVDESIAKTCSFFGKSPQPSAVARKQAESVEWSWNTEKNRGVNVAHIFVTCL